jgi:hypothetical protein
MNIPELPIPERHWSCPNCNLTQVTHEAQPHTRFHACRGLRGLTAPMVADGTRCKVEAVEREDYTHGDDVQTDGEGRAIMAVVTTRENGQDCAVLAGCATVGTEN